MVIEIEGKEYELDFGFGFMEYVADVRGIEAQMQGLKVNSKLGGMTLLLAGLEQEEEVALMEALRGGLITRKSQPSKKDLYAYIKGLATLATEDEDPYGEFVKKVCDEIKKEPLVSRKLRKA